MYTIRFLKLTDEAIVPAYAHEGDAGLDICSVENVVLKAGEFATIKTGISMELPQNTEAQVRPRSGLASKYGITVLNAPGTIDQSYRGEICVVLINHGKTDFEIKKGMRIAQMVIQPTYKVELQETDTLTQTQRGKGGFGSSGVDPLKR